MKKMTPEKKYPQGQEIDEITYYVDKFVDKMNGCTRAVAMQWVNGLGKDNEDAARIWAAILDHKDVYFTKTDRPPFTSPGKDKRDELNPKYLFSTKYTDLLVRIARGEIDATELAIEELINRGLDLNGKWVGFEAAKKNKLR